MQGANRAEAERLLGIAEKLLHSRDLNSSREFAVLAQETEPLLEGPEQILAVIDVLLAADRRVNNQHDWYAILQLDRRTDDLELIKRQYRRLALLLHPDKNKFAFSDNAFRLVADAWGVLSDIAKKSLYDSDITLFSKIDLVALRNQQLHQQQQQQQFTHQQQPQAQNEEPQPKLPVRRNSRMQATTTEDLNGGEDEGSRLSNFWTACPYCYILYEYPRVYENCCLRCQNCQRAFHAAVVPSLPPLVPGKDAYYCCWGFFPLGFASSSDPKATFPNWMPPMFASPTPVSAPPPPSPPQAQPQHWSNVEGVVDVSDRTGIGSKSTATPQTEKRKRGRPPKAKPVQV
ncbi:DnaJ domain [Dillenia turbinata]|uniref:DnaJ domain n=1 Tax=Dillenia turbinata TaxID=194707 RepID=A0AAN8ZHD6_9MAGN